MTCRICLEPGGESLCNCKGSIALVHQKCLLEWQKVSGHHKCEICKTEYKNVKSDSRLVGILVILFMCLYLYLMLILELKN